ncbi:MAG: GntR family transcriptional regulator [Anaerolineae bacterium]|jgi:GntR family transcriptional regulator
MTYGAVQPIRPNRVPLSTQTQQYLLDLIEQGTYTPGEQLPSEKELSVQLGISRSTLREALLNLEQEGIVIRRHGVGTFVAPGYEQRLESGLERLESILELAARQGFQVRIEGLEVRQAAADPNMCDKLQVPPGTEITSVRRAILVDETPVAYMADFVLSSILSPDEVDETFNGSVLDLLREKQLTEIGQVVAHIVAVTADRRLSDRLKVKRGQALLLLEETVFTGGGEIVECSRNYFVPDHFQFHVVRR